MGTEAVLTITHNLRFEQIYEKFQCFRNIQAILQQILATLYELWVFTLYMKVDDILKYVCYSSQNIRLLSRVIPF